MVVFAIYLHTVHVYMYPSHPESLSHLPPHLIPLSCHSVQALSALFHALNLDWSSISHMVIYMFQCYSLKPSHPRLLPQRSPKESQQSPKLCSLHLCLFCCLAYKVVVTIFLNSIYICVNILYWHFSFWLTSLCKKGSASSTSLELTQMRSF